MHVSFFDIYETSVGWHDEQVHIPADSEDTEPMIGMRLLHGYEISVQVAKDGHVFIKKLV